MIYFTHVKIHKNKALIKFILTLIKIKCILKKIKIWMLHKGRKRRKL